MDRYPIIITIGAALLGWVAGDMSVTDPIVGEWVKANAPWLPLVAKIGGAAIVVIAGTLIARRAQAKKPHEPLIDLAEQGGSAGGAAAKASSSGTSTKN
jgi:predicted tellurium resistance membrane protein TerC